MSTQLQPIPAPVRYREAVLASTLTGAQRHFLLTIAKWLDWETLSAFPAQSTIAEMMNCSVRSVQRYIGQLESIGILRVLRQTAPRTNTLIVMIDHLEAVARPEKTKPVLRLSDNPKAQGDNLSPKPDKVSSTTRHTDEQTHQSTSHGKPLQQDVGAVANLIGWSEDRVLHHPNTTAERLRHIVLESSSAKKPSGFAYKCLVEGWHVPPGSNAANSLRRERIRVAWRGFEALTPEEQHERVRLLSEWNGIDLSLPSNLTRLKVANWEYFAEEGRRGTQDGPRCDATVFASKETNR
ncbi:MAG: helix-turn-helix domain-containing protein [Planctomycetota bacterium]